MFKIFYEVNPDYIFLDYPNKAHYNDSGFDFYCPEKIVLKPKERKTICLQMKFKTKLPWYGKLLNLFGIGIELQIRPKSGRSKAGIDVELGTGDEGYRNYYGATITNTTELECTIKVNEKICQGVFVPVFNRIKLIHGTVNDKTSRGIGGFGSSGLKK